MTEELEPHIARIIRDKTLKRVGSDLKKLDETLESIPFPKITSVKKAVKLYADFLYKTVKSKNLAIIKFTPPSSNAKNNIALIGTWHLIDSTLYAIGITINGFPIPRATPLYEIRVRDHAIQRVSQRLGTIDDVLVRNELSVAAGSILMSVMQLGSGEYYARTPHGVALVRKFEDNATVLTTWISNEMLKRDQIKKEWEPFDKSITDRMVSSTGEKLYKLQEQ